jgi:hypothetical protein
LLGTQSVASAELEEYHLMLVGNRLVNDHAIVSRLLFADTGILIGIKIYFAAKSIFIS